MSAVAPRGLTLEVRVFWIPLVLFVGTFFAQRPRPYFYAACLALWVGWISPLTVAVLAAATILVYLATQVFPSSRFWTSLLLVAVGALTLTSQFRSPGTWGLEVNWPLLMVHLTWGLKLISWIVTERIHKFRIAGGFGSFLEFFFHPVFFFLTNDLNVLTPKRFFSSAPSGEESSVNWREGVSALKTLLLGLVWLFAYAWIQRNYFGRLSELGFASSALVGGAVSVVTAIVFHAANVYMQIAFFKACGYGLEVDMDRPWLANSPLDYWRRMHFYVREFIFEMIAKPVLTTLLRSRQSPKIGSVIVMAIIYLLFTATQIGYQPFRQERSPLVGLLVTAVFVAMIAIPEALSERQRFFLFSQNKMLGRLLTFLILTIGYAFIFIARRGF